MADGQTSTKVAKAGKTLDDEIQAAAEKLRKLQERKRESVRKERERNTKAVLDLLRDEKLDQVPAELWQKSLPQLRKLLQVENITEAASVEKQAA